ncbi:MAG: hypothetical protein CR975_03300 [Gammaproteobacteria bacterium]|nr:MAG: hypothetical protein CR975_03300 [Gammaproteobacteria bacterium]
MTTLPNPHIIKQAKSVIAAQQTQVASFIVIVTILPFIAKFGSLIGPAIPKIIEAGPALIFQELGNLGTILISLPVAVLLFKMGRETIGATYSIAREPNIALISDRYGLKSPEGIGVMGVYVMGTMFGTLYFALMASFLASMQWFDIKALAMACGVGSGSMTAACSGSLASVVPAQKDEILAFAGASNLLTNATGLYLAIFVALPFTEWFYKKLSRHKVEDQVTDVETTAIGRPAKHLGISESAVVLAVYCLIGLISNWAGTGVNPVDGFLGMLILYVLSMVGVVIHRYVRIGFPTVAWVSLISVLLTMPFSPVAPFLLDALKPLNFLSIVTPVLGYAGLAISQMEVKVFKRSGLKIAIVAMLIFTGTFIGSALVADLLI